MRKPNSTCCNCNNPCYVRPKDLRSAKNWYCSMECYLKDRYKGEIKSCACCGERLVGKSSEAKYCSRTCSNKGRTGIKYDGTNSRNKYLSHKVVRRLLIERSGEKCEWCGLIANWNGKPLTLQIDHINGDRSNNNLGNLRFLCPNCHTQTDTYAGRKRKVG